MVVRTTIIKITRKSLKTNETSQEMTMKYTKITLTLIQRTNFLKKSHSVLILYQDRETPPSPIPKALSPSPADHCWGGPEETRFVLTPGSPRVDGCHPAGLIHQELAQEQWIWVITESNCNTHLVIKV